VDGNQPTVTIEAASPKHRKKDVLPLHPELLAQLRDWIQGLAEDEFLFPNLAKRRGWKMVKLDLERAGIPYRTKEGIAGFHATGRHLAIDQQRPRRGL
jgi:integrase